MDIILNHENEEVYSWNFCPIFLNATPGPVFSGGDLNKTTQFKSLKK